MTERIGFGFNELHAEERGLLLGLSLLATGDVVLSRLAGDRREVLRDAWQVLRALPRSGRASLLAGWIVETNAPFPPGMERLHPSWLAEVVACEPAELWPALLCGLPGVQVVESLLASAAGDEGAGEARGERAGLAVRPEALAGGAGGLPTRQSHSGGAIAKAGEAWPADSVAELQRCVFSQLASLCVAPSGPLGAGLCRLGCEELLAEVARRGAALCQELSAEGDASLWAVAGRLPATLGRQWVKW